MGDDVANALFFHDFTAILRLLLVAHPAFHGKFDGHGIHQGIEQPVAQRGGVSEVCGNSFNQARQDAA